MNIKVSNRQLFEDRPHVFYNFLIWSCNWGGYTSSVSTLTLLPHRQEAGGRNEAYDTMVSNSSTLFPYKMTVSRNAYIH